MPRTGPRQERGGLKTLELDLTSLVVRDVRSDERVVHGSRWEKPTT
jgi:hypothetical protein